MLPKASFTINDIEIIERKNLYKRFFQVDLVTLKHRHFDGSWGAPISRELLVRGNAVGALLYDPINDLIGLVEQFRVGGLNEASGPWLFEVVAGMFDGDETAEEVVMREVKEEADLTPERLEFICDYLSSPGGTTEKLYLYCALGDLSNAGGVFGVPEEGENIRVHIFTADEVFKELYSGKFNNAAVLICLQWLMINRSRLRATS